ncbi:MAG: WD40 repeat domain-containing protein [Lentimicrobium sp.]
MDSFSLSTIGDRGNNELTKSDSGYLAEYSGDHIYFRMKSGSYNSGIRSMFYYKEDHALVVSYLSGNSVHIFNLGTGMLREHKLHKRTVRNLAVHNNEIISAGWDGTVRLVNYYSLQERLCLTEEKMGRSPHAVVSSDGKSVYAFSYDSDLDPLCNQNIVRKWNIRDGRLQGIITETGVHSEVLRSGMSLEYNDILYVISNSGYLTTYRTTDLSLIASLFITKNLRTFCLCQEHNFLLITDITGNVHFYHLGSHEVLFKFHCHTRDVSSIRMIPWSGDHFCTISFDGTIKIWELPDLNCVSTCKIGNSDLWSMDFINQLLLTGGDNGQIDVFDLKDLSHPEFVATIHIFGNSAGVFPKGGGHYFTNNTGSIEVLDKTTGIPIHGKTGEYLTHSWNSLSVLHDVFGKPRDVDLLGMGSDLRLQLSMNNK